MKKFNLGEKVTIPERYPEGRQNKGVVFEVVDYPYHSESGEDFATIENKDLKITYKAFLTWCLDKA